jgi:hypothetical protein
MWWVGSGIPPSPYFPRKEVKEIRMAKITTLSCDIETYSSIDLAKCGVYRYSQSPDFEILLFGYSIDGGEVQVIDLACGEKIPPVIVSALSDPTITKWAFNAQFERICLSRFLGFPTGTYLDPDGWHCTMVWSATLGLPLSLEGAGAVLGLEKQKLQEGKNLIKYFCVPCAANKANGGRRRNLPQHDMEKWKLFKAYNKRDVETEIGIQEKLSKFPVPDTEWDNYRLDQSINDRGIALDMDFVRQAIRCDEITKTKLRGLMQNLTNLENPGSVQQMKEWLADNGLETDTLGKAAVTELIKTAPPDLKEVLSLRQELAKSSVKKYTAMKNVVGSDGRARGLIQFYGANRTGRWCLTGDHEVLTLDGWKRLDEWNGGKIACWNPIGETVSFQKSAALQFPYNGSLYEYTDKRISQLSTPDHKMYVKRRYGGEWLVDTVSNMEKYRPSIPFTGYRRTSPGMEHQYLRVLVMVQADGHYTAEGNIRLTFYKERKVARCKELLRAADIMYSLSTYNEEMHTRYVFTLYARHIPICLRMFQNKTFGTWLFDESADVFFDELVHWDGYRSAKNSIQYVTSNKQNADIIQAFAHITGRCALLKVKNRSAEHPNWSDAYVVDIWLTPKNCHEIRSKPKIMEFNGVVYCAETPTGYFMARRNGKVWVTGNSGRLVQVQNLPQNHLPDLEDARNLIKAGLFDAVDMLYDSTSGVLSELIRTAFVPKDGSRFIVADFSAIEARIIAWFAGEKWRMEVFANGGDIYCASASQMFHVPVEKNGINGHLRQKGKQAELACIAEGQLVLTDKGLVPIEKVTKKHKLWDGEDWVTHDGIVFRGKKEVIEYEGLIATPDHLVWVEGKPEPIPLGIAATSGSHLIQTGDGQRAIRLGENYKAREKVEQEVESYQRQARLYDIRNAGRNHRFTVSGKLVHNCGYGGSIGALKAMGALQMGVLEEELQPLVTAWRQSNPRIVKLWWDVDKAAMTAVRQKTTAETHGIRFTYQSGMLFITLPSGRNLVYVKPRIGVNRFGSDCVTYEGVGGTKKWERIESYGPKFVENIVQATARDILTEAMLRLSAAGFEIVMHVHDEVVLEVPIGKSSIDEICQIMAERPTWAKGLLLSADGFECDFYKKD